MSLSMEDQRKLYEKNVGTLKEQNEQLQFKWVDKDCGCHPYYKVSNSRRIKNKLKRRR